MPIVIEGLFDAVGLLAICALLVVAGLLATIKWWLRPMLSELGSLLGQVPLVGGKLASGVLAVENAVIGTLDAGIQACEGAASDLWHGLELLAKLTGKALAALAGETEAAIRLLRRHTIGALIAVALGPVGLLVEKAVARVQALEKGHGISTAALEADIASARKAAVATAHGYTDAVAKRLAHGIGNDVAALDHTLRGLITGAKTDAEAAASAGLKALEGTTTAAEKAIQDAVDAVKGEVAHLPKPTAAEGLAGLIASVAGLSVLTHVIADEAGLGKAECRSKVKAICSTDPSQWAGLLAGLVPLGFALDLKMMARAAEAAAELAGPAVHELAALSVRAADGP